MPPSHEDHEGQEPEGHRGCCGGRENESHDEQTARQWEAAFWAALGELQKEAVKAKLKTAWGSRIDRAASTVVEAMLEEWKAFHETESARNSFREKLKKSFESPK